MASFLFGGNTGVKSPEQLEQRRTMARQLVARTVMQQPKSLWEGLNAVADAIGYRIEQNRLDTAEEQGRTGATAKYDAILEGLDSGDGDAANTPASNSPHEVAGAPGYRAIVTALPRQEKIGAPAAAARDISMSPARVAGASGPRLTGLLRAYSDPWISPEQKSVLQIYIDRELQKADPKNLQELRKP